MAKSESAIIICDKCGGRSSGKSFEELSIKLRKNGWLITDKKDLCNICNKR